MQPVSVRRRRFYFLAVFCSILPTACGPNLPDQTPIANSRGPLVLPAGPRRIAILDFWTASKDPETTWLAYAVPATLRAKLGASGAVSPVDRDWLQETIREHRRRPIDLVNPRKAIILGRLVGAEMVVLGELTPFGRGRTFNLQFVDVSTAIAVHTFRVQVEVSSEHALFAGLNRMVNASVEALGRKVEVKKVGTAVVKVARFPITPKERKLLDAPPARTLETYILRGKALQARQRGTGIRPPSSLSKRRKKTPQTPPRSPNWASHG